MYWIFRLKLLPNLPFLIREASSIRQNGIKLPSLAQKLSIGDGKSTILILGESTAAGVGASGPEHTLAGNFYRMLGNSWKIENMGKNGLRVAGAYELFRNSDIASFQKLTGLILFLGANDCFKLTSPSTFHQQLKNLIDQISLELNPDWVYLADIPPVHLFPAFSVKMKSFLYTQRTFLQQEMASLARSNQKIVFEPISVDLSPDFFSEDQIHPSDLGYRKIAEFAVEGLKRSSLL